MLFFKQPAIEHSKKCDTNQALKVQNNIRIARGDKYAIYICSFISNFFKFMMLNKERLSIGKERKGPLARL